MNFSLPHKYIPTPAWVSASAFEARPEKRALLGNYIRLLSLSWNRSDKSTPPMREEDCYEFLGLKRRQFFEIIKEMEGMRWLRSERPRPGFVQFFFHGDDPATAALPANEPASAESRTDGAENSTVNAKNRTDFDSMRIEEEESLESLNTKSSSSIIPEQVRKIAPAQRTALEAKTDSEKRMLALIENLPLLFNPEIFGGPLDMKPIWLHGIPEYAMGWIAKAYKERENLLKGGGALGLIVNGLNRGEAPNRWYMDNALKLLTESYLEKVGGLIEYECDYCPSKFDLRAEKEAHEKEEHPYHCMECTAFFKTTEAEETHYDQVHNPDNLHRTQSVPAWSGVTGDESVKRVIQGTMNAEKAWQAVLVQLQSEMPRASFETWVRDAQAVRYDDNALTLTIATRNQYAADWLEIRLTSTIEHLLIGILNQEVEVKFVAAELAEAESE